MPKKPAPGRQISRHQVLIVEALSRDRERWLTANEVASMAKVAPRTARLHLAEMAAVNVLDAQETFPGYRYRLFHDGRENHMSPAAFERMCDIMRAADAFGITMKGKVK